MALISVSNNALSNITALPAGLPTGSLTLIKSITASSSASIEFIHGTNGVVLDGTYSSYVFKFIDIHPATDNVYFQFNMSTDSGSNYNVTKTTTFFTAFHDEANLNNAFEYRSSRDLAQSTSFQDLNEDTGNDNDQSCTGSLQLFNPSSTTYVKHYLSNMSTYTYHNFNFNTFSGGYGNTTSAINAVRFQFSSGNIDDGTIKLYGVK